MNKINKIIVIVFILLIIAIITLYAYVIQHAKICLESTLTNAEKNYEINARLQDLEDTVQKLENELNTK